MKTGHRVLLVVLSLVCTLSYAHAYAKSDEKPSPPAWTGQMQLLEKSLVDAYPYFFTLSAYRSEKNRKTVAKLIGEMRARIHDVPVAQGERLLGDEPLIAGARDRMDQAFQESAKAFALKDFDRSQSLIHGAINKCVACHTAQGYGPQFKKRNDEMFNIYTPTEDKVTGLIAIRQFESAMAVIEKSFSGRSKYKDSPEQLHQLAKLYLLVSYRALGRTDLALAFLKSKQNPVYVKWAQDFKEWTAVEGKSSSERLKWLSSALGKAGESAPESRFALLLIQTRQLHQSLSSKVSKEETAKSYLELAKAYQGLGLKALSDLSEIYLQACRANSQNCAP